MYGSNEKPELKENNNFNPGINQNVTINAAFRSPKKDGTGDPVLCIDVTGPIGQKYTETEWPQSEDKTVASQLIRLRRWVKEVTGTDSFPTTFTSFEDCANQFCAAVNGKNTPLEFKLVYNDKGYLKMPKYDGCVRAMSNPSRLTLSNSESAKCVKTTATPTAEADLGMDDGTTMDLPF